MNGVKKNKKETKNNVNKITNSVNKLINTYNRCELNQIESIEVISMFLFSIGSALVDKKHLTSEEILKEYAINPTFGSALMAQAMHMQEVWSNSTKEKEKL